MSICATTAVAAALVAAVGAGCASGKDVQSEPQNGRVTVADVDAGARDGGAAGDLATSDASAPEGETASPKELAKVARALKRVSKARQLSIEKPVNSRVMERADLIAWVKARVTKEVPASAIVDEGRVLAMLGFLPAGYDYLGGILSLLDAQLAGLYEPDDGTMYLMADLDGEMAETTLDHELTHALQDQHYDLKARTKYTPGASDRQEAQSMLAEGDAMSSMVDVMFARQKRPETALALPDDVFRAQAAEMNMGKAATAPEVMKQSLVAPYIDGTLFVQALRREGGWDEVDTAWTNAPASTEQILHVDKWKKHEAPLMVDPPAAPVIANVETSPSTLASGAAAGPAAAASWTTAETDVYGELELRIMLAQWIGEAAAPAMVKGWGGDRGVLYTRGDVNAFALHVVQDPGVKFAASLLPAIEKKLGVPAAKSAGAGMGPAPGSGNGVICYERADRGPIAIRVKGGELVMTAASRVSAATGAMAPVSNCREMTAWATSIVP